MKHLQALLPLATATTLALLPTQGWAQSATVLAAPIRQVPLQPHDYVTGSLRAVARAELAARESAAVDAILVNEGDTVEQGAVIARLDGRRLQALLAEQKALRSTTDSLIAQREAELDRARQDFETKRTLRERDAISQSEFLDAQREFRVAETRLNSAKVSLQEVDSRIEHLDVRLSDLTVRAPFAGRVVARHVELGEWVTPGESIATLVSTGKIEAWLTVPERFAADVSAHAQEISVQVRGLQLDVDSESVVVVPEVHPRARTFNVVVELDDPQGRLSPGMSVTAWIPTGERRPYFAVDVDSVIRSQESTYIYVVDAGGEGSQATRKEVKVLFTEGKWLAIEGEGLKAGQLVVVEGNERLLPGQPVVVERVPTGEPEMEVAATTRPQPNTL
ncbi:MAG: efflux RND transporter periplasmic adaptor subunit [Verrucomicrobiota bacterium JB022]|nr:efflux RND transporter periplasmic adaptor subunit [Verrucomicrobiota bacterium JB022]